jgi:2,3-bisphosphoglycerate-dependent phosphoglycerate mutase
LFPFDIGRSAEFSKAAILLWFIGESALILIRHGESLWNEKNLFTGCVDVPLTPKGVEEAIEAGKRICNIPIDMIYTSSLIRAQMTAMLAMMQHRRKKVVYLSFVESFSN